MAMPAFIGGAFERIRSFYAELEPRDRMVAVSATVLLSVFVLVFGVWLPLQGYVETGMSGWEHNRELLQWMRGTEAQARLLSGASQKRLTSGQSLLTLVSRSARVSGIKANKLQPEGDDSVSVWFDSVGFNDLVIWLEKLEAEEEVHVRQISINRAGPPGMVNARVVLKG